MMIDFDEVFSLNWNCAQKKVIDCFVGSFAFFILLWNYTLIMCL